ncbi:DUF72 domain-containing protein [Xylophilus sp.]|uniref:DUF72 domain-containing protein n=1 Tax=Xylophilus sp. TaxID=2653893 RepID=UPI0013BA4920|nr:DUF72 domain-containing protein [Xylophilus sp.]KAF1050021.1 MAG: hypothetical protein GAK38_00045 [Xylophilus sp.]
MTATPASIRIGISGWRYAPWRGGAFYPQGLTQARELAYASRQFRAIELNGSFYALQKPESYARWASETPDGFAFTVKAPRYITHILRLEKPELPIANFLASGLFALGPKLGPILWQFPPSMAFDADRFEAFLALLPHDADAAVRLARRHEPRMKGRALVVAGGVGAVRHAVEVRHASFADAAFVRLLRRYKVAWVIADTGGRWPEFEDITADFAYLRLHGADQLYATGYSDAQIDRWADRIRHWSQGGEPADAKRIADLRPPRRAHRDVFCFFDNTMKTEAPTNARRLASLLGAAPTDNAGLF